MHSFTSDESDSEFLDEYVYRIRSLGYSGLKSLEGFPYVDDDITFYPPLKSRRDSKLGKNTLADDT